MQMMQEDVVGDPTSTLNVATKDVVAPASKNTIVQPTTEVDLETGLQDLPSNTRTVARGAGRSIPRMDLSKLGSEVPLSAGLAGQPNQNPQQVENLQNLVEISGNSTSLLRNGHSQGETSTYMQAAKKCQSAYEQLTSICSAIDQTMRMVLIETRQHEKTVIPLLPISSSAFSISREIEQRSLTPQNSVNSISRSSSSSSREIEPRSLTIQNSVNSSLHEPPWMNGRNHEMQRNISAVPNGHGNVRNGFAHQTYSDSTDSLSSMADNIVQRPYRQTNGHMPNGTSQEARNNCQTINRSPISCETLETPIISQPLSFFSQVANMSCVL